MNNIDSSQVIWQRIPKDRNFEIRILICIASRDRTGDNDCPKAIKTERLDKLVEDGNGDSTPLHELIADDKAVDVITRLDARLTLQGYPHKFVKISYKKYAGYPLAKNEQQYYWRQAKKTQKKLVLV